MKFNAKYYKLAEKICKDEYKNKYDLDLDHYVIVTKGKLQACITIMDQIKFFDELASKKQKNKHIQEALNDLCYNFREMWRMKLLKFI